MATCSTCGHCFISVLGRRRIRFHAATPPYIHVQPSMSPFASPHRASIMSPWLNLPPPLASSSNHKDWQVASYAKRNPSHALFDIKAPKNTGRNDTPPALSSSVRT
ncbi:unnamed protein product [Periconia digitata]|uniref:Uncharacterized protein n=1 Tax=Periconia digitata TaxID=1303443 RepID=A0A9W4XVV1_9PLEO|nr:unnamed protein product [Periconia digitata]